MVALAKSRRLRTSRSNKEAIAELDSESGMRSDMWQVER
jgi:hypothetical protein